MYTLVYLDRCDETHIIEFDTEKEMLEFYSYAWKNGGWDFHFFQPESEEPYILGGKKNEMGRFD